MPSVQDEHSSEDSQAFQSLLISDSLDDNADEYPDGLLCVILNIVLIVLNSPWGLWRWMVPILCPHNYSGLVAFKG